MDPGYARLLRFAVRYSIYFAAGSLALGIRTWRRTRRENAARNWPAVEGLIITGTVSPIPKTMRFQARLQYTYFTGEYRTGTYTQEFSSESKADEFVRHARDKRVPIRYKQADPDESVLERNALSSSPELP